MNLYSLSHLDPAITNQFNENLVSPSFEDKDGTLHFDVTVKVPEEGFVCPHCGSLHSKPHNHSTRCCQLFPLAGKAIFLNIIQPRRKCQNPNCSRTFIMNIPGFRIFQRRSDYLNKVILAISIFCNAKDAELICKSLGIKISHDSINRLISHITIQDDQDIEVIGVDDVALKKGHTYSTVIYDGKDHNLIALLDGRDGTELKKWLKKHPRVKCIARDRASSYATAIQEVLPECIQVADRFHLFQNLMSRLKEILRVELPSTLLFQNEDLVERGKKEEIELAWKREMNNTLNTLNYDNRPPIDEEGNIIQFIDKSSRRQSKQYFRHEESRKKKYEKIKIIREEWEKESDKVDKGKNRELSQLAKKHNVSIPTIKKYLNMTPEEVESVLEIRVYKKRETKVNNYLNMIYKMLKDGISPMEIYHYVFLKGYDGSKSSLESHIRAISQNNKLTYIPRNFTAPKKYLEKMKVVTRNDVLKYMTIKDKNQMSQTEVGQYYELILSSYPKVVYLETLWNEFYEVMMGEEPKKLNEFIEKYSDTEMAEINHFIKGIKKDIAPITNAISYSLSSGFVEGGNCRFKATKRGMFGRAGQDHLFRKMYAISIIKRRGIKPQDLIEDWLNDLSRTTWPKRKIQRY